MTTPDVYAHVEPDDLPVMVADAFDNADVAVQSLAFDNHAIGGRGKVVAEGTGRLYPPSDPGDREGPRHFEFEVVAGTHKDAKIVFDPLEVNITFRDGPDADDVADFVLAVACDEYAELELSTGDTVITDWEGDGVFNPYVVTKDGETPDDPDARGDAIAEAAQNALGVPVRIFEYVPDAGDLYYLSISKQDVVGDTYLRSVRQVE